MTDHAAEFEDDWAEDSDDDFGEEFELADEQERIAEVSAEVAAWERASGVTLTDEEFNRMGYQLDLYNISPDESYGETDSGRFEADFESTVEAVEREQGRKLLDPEVDRMWDAATRAVEDPAVADDAAVWTEAREAVPNMLDTSDGAAEYIGQRLAVPQEREEASAVTEDDTPSFNLDNPAEREAAIDAAMSGEAVSTHDNDDLEGATE